MSPEENLGKLKAALAPYLDAAKQAAQANPVASWLHQHMQGNAAPTDGAPAPGDVFGQVEPMPLFRDHSLPDIISAAGKGAAEFFTPQMDTDPSTELYASHSVAGDRARREGYGEPTNLPQIPDQVSPRMRKAFADVIARPGQAPAVISAPDADTGFGRGLVPISAPAAADEWTVDSHRRAVEQSSDELQAILAQLRRRHDGADEATLTSMPMR